MVIFLQNDDQDHLPGFQGRSNTQDYEQTDDSSHREFRYTSINVIKCKSLDKIANNKLSPTNHIHI